MNRWASSRLILLGVWLVAASQPAGLISTGLQSAEVLPQVLEQRTLEHINQERALRGLLPLRQTYRLTRASRQHTHDMAERHDLSHINPDGYTVVDRIRPAGVRGVRHTAENPGKHRTPSDPVTTIVRNWINGPPRRKNILNPRFKFTGLGVVRAEDGTLDLTQLFADC